jgi:hypothetical protein
LVDFGFSQSQGLDQNICGVQGPWCKIVDLSGISQIVFEPKYQWTWFTGHIP